MNSIEIVSIIATAAPINTTMTDPDEVELSKLAKKMLSMPPKKREDSKFGKPREKPNRNPAPNAQTKKPA